MEIARLNLHTMQFEIQVFLQFVLHFIHKELNLTALYANLSHFSALVLPAWIDRCSEARRQAKYVEIPLIILPTSEMAIKDKWRATGVVIEQTLRSRWLIWDYDQIARELQKMILFKPSRWLIRVAHCRWACLHLIRLIWSLPLTFEWDLVLALKTPLDVLSSIKIPLHIMEDFKPRLKTSLEDAQLSNMLSKIRQAVNFPEIQATIVHSWTKLLT